METIVGKLGLTTERWEITNIEIDLEHDGRFQCSACGRTVYRLYELRSPSGERVHLGRECAKNALGGIRFTEAEREFRAKTKSTSSDDVIEDQFTIARRVNEWSEAHPELWGWLCKAYDLDPDDDLYCSLHHRIERVGGLTDKQFALLERLASQGERGIHDRKIMREEWEEFRSWAFLVLLRCRLNRYDREFLRELDRSLFPAPMLWRVPTIKQAAAIDRLIYKYKKQFAVRLAEEHLREDLMQIIRERYGI